MSDNIDQVIAQLEELSSKTREELDKMGRDTALFLIDECAVEHGLNGHEITTIFNLGLVAWYGNKVKQN